MYAVLPSRIEPGFGYITQCSPEQGPVPNQGSPDLIPPDLGVSQVGPVRWRAPLGRILVLLGLGFRPCRALEGGGAYGADPGLFWVVPWGL